MFGEIQMRLSAITFFVNNVCAFATRTKRKRERNLEWVRGRMVLYYEVTDGIMNVSEDCVKSSFYRGVCREKKHRLLFFIPLAFSC